jgi:DNA-binding transcriptional LysR family regulator
LDIRFLQSLVSVIETGSITAAARRDKLTAAAVSQRVQALERSLGSNLLTRGAHSVVPTEACLHLLPRIRLLIREAAQLKDDLDGRPLSGEIGIGAISTVMTGLIPEVLHETAHVAPGLKLRLVPGSSSFLYEQLLHGHLDAALLVHPPFAVPKTLHALLIRREPLMLMSRDPIGIGEIRPHIEAHPLIRYDPLSWGGRLATSYLEKAGILPEVLCDMDALETIAILVARGLGNSLVPAWQGLNPIGVHLTPIPEADAFERQITFFHPIVPSRPQALALLSDILMRHRI